MLVPMSDILFIKTSSLGDVIHHMPAVSDARRHRPEAQIGWVVEEAFAPLGTRRSSRRLRTTPFRMWPRTWRQSPV